MKNKFQAHAKLQVGDTLSIPATIHGLEKKENAIGEVMGIYQYVVTLQQKNGVKFSIYRSDLENYQERGIRIVSRATDSLVEALSNDIMRNI